MNGDEYESEAVRRQLHEFLKNDYAHSIYGSAASYSSCFSHHSSASKQLEVAADLAAKEAEYEVLLKEDSQKEKK